MRFKETLLMNQALNTFRNIRQLYFDTNRLEASGRSVEFVNRVEDRYHRRLAAFVKRVSEFNRQRDPELYELD